MAEVQEFRFAPNRNQPSRLQEWFTKLCSLFSSSYFAYFMVFILLLFTLQLIAFPKDLNVKGKVQVINKPNQNSNSKSEAISNQKVEDDENVPLNEENEVSEEEKDEEKASGEENLKESKEDEEEIKKIDEKIKDKKKETKIKGDDKKEKVDEKKVEEANKEDQLEAGKVEEKKERNQLLQQVSTMPEVTRSTKTLEQTTTTKLMKIKS